MEYNILLPELINLSKKIRGHCLRMIHKAKTSHIGSNLSITELLAHLYQYWLKYDIKNPEWKNRDRLILSKGHAAAAMYAVLAEKGFFPLDWLDSYCMNGSKLYGHISHHHIPGIEISTGSLGHGLSIGVGMALGLKRINNPGRVIVILSDGECDEGSTWEASLIAPFLKLDNLLAIVDYNKFQALGKIEEVIPLEPFTDKWKAFQWSVCEVNGHDHKQIFNALQKVPFEINKPSLILAHTVKGKGVSFMENSLLWHYKSPDDEQLKKALEEIENNE